MIDNRTLALAKIEPADRLERSSSDVGMRGKSTQGGNPRLLISSAQMAPTRFRWIL
jgi:hypothetical protein